MLILFERKVFTKITPSGQFLTKLLFPFSKHSTLLPVPYLRYGTSTCLFVLRTYITLHQIILRIIFLYRYCTGWYGTVLVSVHDYRYCLYWYRTLPPYHLVWYRHNIPKLPSYNLCSGKKVPTKKITK